MPAVSRREPAHGRRALGRAESRFREPPPDPRPLDRRRRPEVHQPAGNRPRTGSRRAPGQPSARIRRAPARPALQSGSQRPDRRSGRFAGMRIGRRHRVATGVGARRRRRQGRSRPHRVDLDAPGPLRPRCRLLRPVLHPDFRRLQRRHRGRLRDPHRNPARGREGRAIRSSGPRRNRPPVGRRNPFLGRRGHRQTLPPRRLVGVLADFSWGRPSACGGLSGRLFWLRLCCSVGQASLLSILYGIFSTKRGGLRGRRRLRARPTLATSRRLTQSGFGVPGARPSRPCGPPAGPRRVKGLHQNVIATQIQDLGPKPLVGQAGRDDQVRWIRPVLQIAQQEPPVAVRDFGIANGDSDVAPIQNSEGFGVGGGLLDFTRRQCKDVAQRVRRESRGIPADRDGAFRGRRHVHVQVHRDIFR